MRTTQTGDQKVCNKCNQSKHIDLFPKADPKTKSYNKYKNGIKPWCKECYRTYNTKYMKKMRGEGTKAYSHYYKKYGLTQEEVIQMHEERLGKCDICGCQTDHRYDKLCVDHSHDTGKVRGLLCFSCNTALGNFKDNIENLKNAISYLEKNREYICD
jgi:hypothetical protein